MKHILFVCHGNICRSPMAEFIFKKFTRLEGVESWFDVASAALTDEEVGNPVYPLARRELATHGIGSGGKVARMATPEDYNRYDLIIGMDSENMALMHSLFPNDEGNKLHLLMDYTSKPRDIADPWYTRDFRAAWTDIYEGCRALFDSFLPQAKSEVSAEVEQADDEFHFDEDD